MKKYHYFISFHRESNIGNAAVSLDHPIETIEDIRKIEAALENEIAPDILLISFNFLQEEDVEGLTNE